MVGNVGATAGLLLLLSGAAAAQQKAAPSTGVSAPAAAAVPENAIPLVAPTALPTTPITLPFELQDNLVRMKATVNGKPQNAVLDSGTGLLVVDRGAAARIGLIENGPGVEAAGAGRGEQQMKPVELGDIRVGPLGFSRIGAYAGDLSPLSTSAGFPIDVLIGDPAFRYGAVTIDYPRRRVTFGPSGSAATCKGPIPLTLAYGTPVVEIMLRPTARSAPVRLKMMVDLGTRRFAAMVNGPFLNSAAGKALAASGKPGQVGTGTGGKVQGIVARVAELRIGEAGYGARDVALTTDIKPIPGDAFQGTLGVPLWLNGTITFDYPKRQLCIDVPA